MTDAQLLSLAWTQLFQITVVFAAVLLLVRTAARRRPYLAHALWFLVLVKCITPPVMASPTGLLSYVSAPRLDRWVLEWLSGGPVPEARGAASGDGPIVRPERHSASVTAVDDLSRGVAIDGDPFAERHLSEGSGAWRASRGENQRTVQRQAGARLWIFWFGSAGAALLVAIVRVRSVLRRAYRRRVETPEALEHLAARLSRQLKLRRRVGVLVTASRVGPAVVGIFHPRLILPEVVTRGRTARELAPIIAHELLHVKRGDLAVGWLQLLVQALWWFHPLVWLVNRYLSRESERCCDEAVLAELNCGPAAYARCLLHVLEQKRSLIPIPACPGVKPFELTKERMERIMQLGQDSRKRSPWWCWPLVALLGAVVLPARGASNAVDAEPRMTLRMSEARAVEAVREKVLVGRPLPGKESAPSVRLYKVEGLLERVRTALALEQRDAPRALQNLVLAVIRTGEFTGWIHGDTAQVECLENGLLLVRASEAAHRHVEDVFELWNKVGLYQVQLEVTIATGPVELSADRLTGWSQRKTAVTASLSAGEQRAWRETLRGDARIDQMHARVTLFNGQRALVRDESERPFVTSLDGTSPLVEIFPEGIRLAVEASVDAKKNVQLDVQLRVSEIGEVETAAWKGRDGAPSASVQVPDVQQVQVRSTRSLREGEALAIGGVKRGGGRKSLTIMIRPTIAKIPPPAIAQANREDALDLPDSRLPMPPPAAAESAQEEARGWLKLYSVGDLIVPLPGTEAARGVELRPASPRARRPPPPGTGRPWAVRPLAQAGPQGTPAPAALPETNPESHANPAALIELIRYRLREAHGRPAEQKVKIDFLGEQLSLVIRGSARDHETVADLLSSIRRKQSLQVSLECLTVRFENNSFDAFWNRFGSASARVGPAEGSKRARVLHGAQRDDFRAKLDELENADVIMCPKLTVFNGVGAQVHLHSTKADREAVSTMRFMVVPTVSEDGRAIDVKYALNATSTLDALKKIESLTIPDGGSALIEVTDETLDLAQRTGVPEVDRALHEWKRRESGDRTFLLVTPRVITQ